MNNLTNFTTLINQELQEELDRELEQEFNEKIHLRIYKRNNRKCRTTLENIPSEINPKKLLK